MAGVGSAGGRQLPVKDLANSAVGHSPAGGSAVRHVRQAQHEQHPRWQRSNRGSIRHTMLDATRRAWAQYWTARAQRATAGILHRLDDRTLKDIGIDRSEIESVVYGDRCGRGQRLPERRVCMG
jgi:uncharacterized protein YjiS (DUF1127 family)